MAQLAFVQAAQVVAVIPPTSGAPTAPGHVILFLSVRIARLVARTHAGSRIIVIGVDDRMPRHGGPNERGSKDCSTSQQCEFRHASLHLVVPRNIGNVRNELAFRSWFQMGSNRCDSLAK